MQNRHPTGSSDCDNNIRLIPGDRIKQDDGFQDVTDKFRQLVQELPPGELVKSPAFHAYDFVSAVQMGDPSMDSGQIYMGYIEKDIKAIQSNGDESRDCVMNFDINNNLNLYQILGHMEYLLSCQACWHNGASLSQTILSSGYVWKVLELFKKDGVEYIENIPHDNNNNNNTKSILLPYIFGVIKACDFARNVVATGICLDEEDLITNDYGFELLTTSNSDNDELSDEIIKQMLSGIDYLKRYGNDDDSLLLSGIENHIRLQIVIIQISSIGPLEQGGLKKLTPLLEDGLKYLEILKNTKLLKNTTPIPGSISSIFQSKLGGEGPPRPIISLSFNEAVSRWITIFNQLAEISWTIEVWSCCCQENIFPLDWYTSKPQDRRKSSIKIQSNQQQREPPKFGSLIEYLKQITFHLFVNQDERYPFVFGCIAGTLCGVGAVGFTRGVQEDVYSSEQASSPLIWVYGDKFISIRELILNDIFGGGQQQQQDDEEFIIQAERVGMHIIFDLLSNRCRQYSNFGHCIIELDSLHVIGQDIDLNNNNNGQLSHWVYVNKLEVMIIVGLLGFPLEIYQPGEYMIMYKYISYLYNEYINYLKISINYINNNKEIINKKINYGEIHHDMSNGMSELFNGFELNGYISSIYNNKDDEDDDDLYYKLRMKPFSSVGCPRMPNLYELTRGNNNKGEECFEMAQKLMANVVNGAKNDACLKRSATYARLGATIAAAQHHQKRENIAHHHRRRRRGEYDDRLMSITTGGMVDLFYPAVSVKRL